MSGSKAGAANRGDADEAGFTVIEVSIVMLIATAVMAALMGLLVSQSNAAARMENFVDNQEDARLALVALQRDLRSAESIVALAPGIDARFGVDLKVYPSPTAEASETVRWRVTPERELVREKVLSNGAVDVTYALSGVTNLATGAPLLAYYNSQSATLDPDAQAPRVIAECTVRVRIDLRAGPRPGPAPVRLTSDVQLRNRIDGGAGC